MSNWYSPQDREIVARNLKALRRFKHPCRGGIGIMAKEVGVTPTQWSLWENGKRFPNEKSRLKIANYCGLEPSDVFRPDLFTSHLAFSEPALVTEPNQPPQLPTSTPGTFSHAQVSISVRPRTDGIDIIIPGKDSDPGMIVRVSLLRNDTEEAAGAGEGTAATPVKAKSSLRNPV